MIKFDRIPVLAEHISIPPHKEVNDAKHSYSFTELGGDLCFHSPEALPEGASSLAAFLNSVTNGFPNSDRKIRPERAAEELRLLIGSDSEQEILPGASALLQNHDPISSWMEFGYMLNHAYGIEQFALVNWKD